jgi:signal transduction histidine kinase
MEREGDILRWVHEQTRQYTFHNDQMLRGPLFRVKGMLQLFRKELWSADQQKLLEILQGEVEQMEKASSTMARMLEEHEARIQRLIEGREQL